FAGRRVRVQLGIQLDADFADIFEVKAQSLPSRLAIGRAASGDGLSLRYERGGFQRGLQVRLRPPGRSPTFVGSFVAFDLDLAPGAAWECRLELAPVVDGKVVPFAGDARVPEIGSGPDACQIDVRAEAL